MKRSFLKWQAEKRAMIEETILKYYKNIECNGTEFESLPQNLDLYPKNTFSLWEHV